MLFAFAALVYAAPAPSITVWEGRVSTLAGVQADESPMFATELAHALGAAGTLSRGGWSARWVGYESAAVGDALRSVQSVDLGLAIRHPLAPGTVAAVQVGTPTGWTTNSLVARVAPARGPFWLDARGGAALHTEPSGHAWGATSSVLGEFRLNPRARIGVALDGQTWFDIQAPPLAGNAYAYGGWTPSPTTSLTVIGGVTAAAVNEAANPAWIGLPTAGASDGWGRLRVSWSPAEAVWLVADGGGRVRFAGESAWQVWALGGVEVRFSGLHVARVSDAPVTAVFTVRAPDAARVGVAGEFNRWMPVPMQRARDGTWQVEIELPPGTYEYVYLVDGVATVPPEARARVDDGLGGENGLLVVVRGAAH